MSLAESNRKDIEALGDYVIRSNKDWFAVFPHKLTRLVILSEELDETKTYTEGSVVKVSVNRYERDPNARKACIARKGAKCVICDFAFEKFYEKRMKGFTHVHHRNPIYLTKSEYKVDPVEDLEPVYPNCHAVLHSKQELLSIEQVKKLIKENNANKSCHTTQGGCAPSA